MASTDLLACRRAYARKICGLAGVTFPALERAFASVPREDFLGDPPWRIFHLSGNATAPTSDVADLYDDVLISLIPERRLNNGQPSGHALWMDAARPAPGEHAVHVGTGAGYYTAILAELVGPSGRVTGIEFDAGLAARAAQNLAPWPQVTIHNGDGCTFPFDPADAIYVSAGATHPADSWLDRLKQSGRLVVPLTSTAEFAGFPMGGVFRIERRGEEFLAGCVSPTAFYPCEGCRDEASGAALAAAFRKGGVERVTRLVRHGNLPQPACWLRTPTWSLIY
jgi:protein-L-isoaspartate(D-aspartate) O-methyltransferase